MSRKPKFAAKELAEVASPPLTDDELARMRPAKEVVPEIVAAARRYRGQRGPQKEPTKELVSLRLDREVLAYFRAGGAGWQTRINEALTRAVRRKGRPRPQHARKRA